MQVAWTRAEEFYNDTFDPASVVKIVSGLDGKGTISLWDSIVYAAGERGAVACYAIAHARLRSTEVLPTLRPLSRAPCTFRSPWDPGGDRRANIECLRIESQIDTMAAAVGEDPLAFRLHNLTDPRMRRVLQAASEAFGWQPQPRRAAGLRHRVQRRCRHLRCNDGRSQVDSATARVKVPRVACAQDMGIVVNPEGARMQIEGGITMGLGYTLSEELRFLGGDISRPQSSGRTQIPRFPGFRGSPPSSSGMTIWRRRAEGKPRCTTTGAVIANAIFDATGARLYRLPMTPARVRAALSKSGTNADRNPVIGERIST